MDSLTKGKYCELLVLTRLTQEQKEIAIPYGTQKGWDILVWENTKWEKWQIKTACKRKRTADNIYVACRKSNRSGVEKGKYKEGDFDYLVAVYPETGEMWKIPIKLILNQIYFSLKTFQKETSVGEKFKW